MNLRDRTKHLRTMFQFAFATTLPVGCTEAVSPPIDASAVSDVPDVLDAHAAPDVPTAPDIPTAPDVPAQMDGCGNAIADAQAYADVAHAPEPDASACQPLRYSNGCQYESDIVWPCGLPDELARSDAGDYCRALCVGAPSQNTAVENFCNAVTPRTARPFVIHCGTCCKGRRPEGLAMPDLARESDAGGYLAWLAALESASVVSFERLAAELAALDAPADLVTAARAAARDEVRHAAAVGALARARGAAVSPTCVEPVGTRTLEAIARENAVEGCVYETWAAMIAWWQIDHARADDVGAAARRIARDETRHAALAWSVHGWSLTRLDADAATALSAALQSAVAELGRAIETPAPPVLVSEVGLPSRADAQRLFAALRASVWADA